MDDSAGFIAAVASEDEFGEFTIRCMEGKTDVFVRLLKTYSSFDSSGVRVTYRIDTQKPIKTKWGASADNKAVFSLDAIKFLKSLPQSSRLLVRIEDYRGSERDYEFDLSDLDEKRAKVAATCKWKP